MSHYEKELNEQETALKNELRKQIRLKINEFSKDELEFVFIVVAHLKVFRNYLQAVKALLS